MLSTGSPDHPDEAGTVRLIFEALAAMKSPSEVAESLNDRGLRTKRRREMSRSGDARWKGGKPFRGDLVCAVVRNPIYAGRLRYEGELYEGLHEALVGEETWDGANAALEAGKRSRASSGLLKRDGHVHLLKGLIRCGDCGSTMTPYPSGKTGKDGERYLYYTCTDVVHNARRSKCRVRTLPARRFERSIGRLLAEIADQPEMLADLISQQDRRSANRLRVLNETKSEYDSRLQVLEDELSRFLEVFKGEDRIPRSLKEECLRLDDEREQLREDLAGVTGEIEALEDASPSFELLHRSLLEVRASDALALEDQKALMQGIIGRITVNIREPRRRRRGTSGRGPTPETRTRNIAVTIHLNETPQKRALRGVYADQWILRLLVRI